MHFLLRHVPFALVRGGLRIDSMGLGDDSFGDAPWCCRKMHAGLPGEVHEFHQAFG